MGCSNALVSILNFLSFLLSIPIIIAGVWLSHQHGTECYRFLQWPVITLGVFVLLVSLAGFVGSACRVTCLLWLYLVVMFLLIFLLFVFTIFAFVVTNRTAGQIVSNRGYKEYSLGDYSTWLQRQINKASNWEKVQSCLSASKVCDALNDNYPTETIFNNANLSPIESGCCKPPTGCGCTFVNATVWKNCNATYSTDCTTYNPDPATLCLNCDSCRAGVLQNITKDWRQVAKVNIAVLVFLIIVYSVGCCAFRNVKRDNYQKGHYP